MGYRSRPCLRLSVFVFDNDILQVYRDKNLRLNLDLCTPSLSNLYLNLDLRTPSLSSLYFNLDLRTPSLLRINTLTSISATSSLSRVNIRNTPRGYIFFVSSVFRISFAPSPQLYIVSSTRDEC